MFVYKTLEELQKMSVEEQKTYLKEKEEHEAEARKAEIEAAIAEFKTKSDEESKAEIDKLEKKLATQQKHLEMSIASINALGEQSKNEIPTTIKQEVHKYILENKDKIQAAYRNKTGEVAFTIKVVGDVTTGSATNPDGIPELVGTQVAPADNVNLRGTYIDELVTSISTDLAAYPYTESLPKDGDYAFVAEGNPKPQIDFKIETRYAQPVKVAAHEILTEESVTDIRGLQSIATDFLRKKHDLKRQNGIMFGDGIAPNPKGATVYGRLFSAGPMALAVDTPNFMDVVNACITDIYTTHNYQDETAYMANLAMISPSTFFIEFQSAKDANGLPLYPMASLFNQVTIGGVTIKPERDIPDAKIFVADMSKYNVTNYVSYTVRIGWINDQFITNKFTMVGESRFHAFVKKLDEQAFIYDDHATIKTAITKL